MKHVCTIHRIEYKGEVYHVALYKNGDAFVKVTSAYVKACTYANASTSFERAKITLKKFLNQPQ